MGIIVLNWVFQWVIKLTSLTQLSYLRHFVFQSRLVTQVAASVLLVCLNCAWKKLDFCLLLFKLMFLATFLTRKSPKPQKKFPQMIKMFSSKIWLKDGALLRDLSKSAFKLVLAIWLKYPPLDTWISETFENQTVIVFGCFFQIMTWKPDLKFGFSIPVQK